MSSIDTTPSPNGRVSETWSQPWTHLSVDRRSPSYGRVTFQHPPINTITATTVVELAELVGLIEDDPDLNVVVFDSDSEFPPALADFFEMLGRPEQRVQNARLEALGLNMDSDFERSLGRRVVELLPEG